MYGERANSNSAHESCPRRSAGRSPVVESVVSGAADDATTEVTSQKLILTLSPYWIGGAA